MLVFANVVLLLEFAVEEDRGEFEFTVTIVNRRLLFNRVAILLLFVDIARRKMILKNSHRREERWF
jgi:hypothetical protein